jgi:hypothetical protein
MSEQRGRRAARLNPIALVAVALRPLAASWLLYR